MDWERWGRWFVCNLLAQGPIPRHVAFIMDGNRRFAVVRAWEHGFRLLGSFDFFSSTSNMD